MAHDLMTADSMYYRLRTKTGKPLGDFELNANLRNANLRNADLCDANLRNADLCGADLCGADLRNANLRNADLRNANLRNANLCDANLCDANLCDADLRKADLRGANLCDADLCDADLCGADLCGTHTAFIEGVVPYRVILQPGCISIGCKRYNPGDLRSISANHSDVTYYGLASYLHYRDAIMALYDALQAD